MRSVAPMHAAKIGYIVISLVLCFMGTLLIAMPNFSASLFDTICGIVLITFGAIKIVGYFSKDLYRLAFQYDLTSGMIAIIIGLLMLFHLESLKNSICVILGLFILEDGILKAQISIDAKKFGINEWWIILSLAVIAGICGLLLIFYPSESAKTLTVFFGINLISEGLLNLSTAITFVKIIHHQKPDVIKTGLEYEERED